MGGRTGRNSRRRYTVAALERGLDVLRVLADAGDATLREAARRARMPKPTVFRLLATLEARGFVERTVEGVYRPGLRLIGLVRSAQAATDLRRVAQRHLAYLHRLSQDTVNLAIWRGGAVVYLEVLPSPRPLRFVAPAGSVAPLHATALGKAVAAHLAPAEAAAALRAAPLVRYTPRTITTLSRLVRELRRVRGRGYAVDREEQDAGAVCVAVPLFDGAGVVGALSIAAPAARMAGDRLAAFLPELLKAGNAISGILGHAGRGRAPRPARSRPAAARDA